jgi:hypothetical protein
MPDRRSARSVHVTPRDRGRDGWATKTGGAARAEGVYPTQHEAEQRGRELLLQRGGGELVTHHLNGEIRSKDAIAPGHDPNPPRDKEH